MIVDHLCHGVSGGAAGAAVRIHRGLLGAGIHSRFWHSPKVQSSDSTPNCQPITWPTDKSPTAERIVSSVNRTLRDGWTKLRHYGNWAPGEEYFSTGNMRQTTNFPASQIDGDILVLHWLGKLVDYESFFSTVPPGRPVVWVMHDMNPFTGGCHFSNGCDQFTSGCGHCPMISKAHTLDITATTSSLKSSLYRNIDLHAVAPSTWLSGAAAASKAMSVVSSHRVIPYGINIDVFRPEEKLAARKELGLPLDRQIIAFGADSVTNARKGFRFLEDIWPRIDAANTMGVMFGGGRMAKLNATAEIRHFGYIRDAHLQRSLYSAADVFALPSLEDNLPQTGLESMACGTPVVAFDTGGIPDYVLPGRTGMLAKLGCADSLFENIHWILDHDTERLTMGSKARRLIETNFSQQVEVNQYRDLFASILPKMKMAA
ncbi:MAG: glycosyltransferase [Rubripirellula sp.]|nr:glycosyltransferase [Rubripirellula sp.]